MKKLILTMALGALSYAGAQAQAVYGYTLAEQQGTYVPLTDATLIYDAAAAGDDAEKFESMVFTPQGAATESGSASGYSLGFTMGYAGTTCTDFLVSASGYIYLGNGEIEFDTSMKSYFMTYDGDYNIFGFSVLRGVSSLENTKISYKTEGSGDDARLVVQFENMGLCYNFWDPGVPVNLQLSLDAKGNGSIIMDSLSALAEAGGTLQLRSGVRQGAYCVSADGEPASMTLLRNANGQLRLEGDTPDGMTLNFTAPGPCVKPDSQPTGLRFDNTSNRINAAYDAAEGADTYLAVYTTGDGKAELPANGTAYAAGDLLGDAIVAYYGPDTEFSIPVTPGSDDYVFTIYAVNSYGSDGPVYNTENPLTAVTATLPAPPASVTLGETGLDSIALTVESNADGDDIVVVCSTYCERDNFGDHGLVGPLPANAVAGDVLPVPEDYTPLWTGEYMPAPKNGGVVAFAGKTSGEIVIEGLLPSTQYFISVYTRNADGAYTSLPVETGSFTTIEYPYNGDSYDFPRYSLPLGWSGSDGEDNTLIVRNDPYVSMSDMAPSQGSQIMQQHVYLTRGDAVNGKEAWLTPAPVYVNDRHLTATFSYCIVTNANRFQSSPYNEWEADDVLQLRLSEDGGQTWTPLTSFTADNHPLQEETLSYVEISGDLSDWRGKTVLLQLYWKTYTNPGFGGNMYIDRFSIGQAEFPAVPEVTVGGVTHDSAVVSWVSQQTDYELEYGLKGSEDMTVVTVEAARSYTLQGLEANTEYEVKVRGLLGGEEGGYSEWSDVVSFTTADWPEVEAPENLVADMESYAPDGYVLLSWDAADDALSYEVALRLASATEWTYENTEETSLLLTALEPGENYICKVRAFCTHDRETAYSAQLRFTAPIKTSAGLMPESGLTVRALAGTVEVRGAAGMALSVYNAAGVKVAAVAEASAVETFSLQPGIYIVSSGSQCCRTAVR
ncbi:MAG: fibronectin type III domain-containing protein [Muribaculaceae bacterium]|nr:fibronectin type III domain-containing protein [Muribaculaceae bacterium]